MGELPKLAVFASGNGSNLQAIVDGCASGEIKARVAFVFSDKKDAFALTRAEKVGIPTVQISPKTYATREEYDTVVAQTVRERTVDWVILAGFMRILTPKFVRPFLGKIINIHPALLPAYPGTHSIERAYEAKEKRIGVTVHFVDEGVDTGPIILQDSIEVNPGESLESVTERVHELEHRLYPAAITRVLEGKARFKGGLV
jgi:phosphoribosylglycinamide formyltransferase 1